MMDFISSLLLWAGLGLLLIVILFALWGFLGGLKRELTWTIVCLVLLLLAWLIFGDAATLLNSKGILVRTLKGMLPGDLTSCVSLWDVILALGKEYIPNGEALLVEGKETYTLFYDIASGLVRGIGMMVITLVVFLITPFIRLITHIVWLIVRAVRRGKAKRLAEEVTEEETPEDEASTDVEPEGEPTSTLADSVVISESDYGLSDVIITVGENDAPAPCPLRKRIWGAVAGALKGVAVIIILFTPIAGICSVVGSATPETRQAIADLVEGDTTTTAEGEESVVDLAFGFVDAYYQSGIGSFVEGSAYFFGDSFSTLLFDSSMRVDTNGQRIALRQELITFIAAANALDGKFDQADLGKWTQEEVNNALEALKDSKLLVALMPVAIEFVYEDKEMLPINVRELLANANQTAPFLELRDINWDKDLELVLDAVKEAYKLDLFADDFNYLKLNPDILYAVVDKLGDTELIAKALPIAINTALRMEEVTKLIGSLSKNPDLSTVTWKQELIKLVDMYDIFQDLGVEDINELNVDFLKEVLNDDALLDTAVLLVLKAASLDLFSRVVLPVGFNYALGNDTVNDYLEKANQVDAFKALQKLNWEKELKNYSEAAKKAIELFNLDAAEGESMIDIFNLDSDVLKNVITDLFKTESFAAILSIGGNIALSLDKVKELTGNQDLKIDFSTINWQQDLNGLVEIYTEFKKLGFTSMDDFKKELKDLANDILIDKTKYDAVEKILTDLPKTGIFMKVLIPTADAVIDEFFKKEEWKDYTNILNINEMELADWQADLKIILNIAKEATTLNALTFDLKQMDLTSEDAIAIFKNVINEVFSLKVLGTDQTKTLLLTATLKKFGIVEENPDFSKVKWTSNNASVISEKDVLISIIDQYAKLTKLEGFDINNLEFDYKKLLNEEAIFDIIIDTLDDAVESQIVLEILPDLINKYLVPIIEEQTGDTDDVFKDILNGLSSKELVEEIKKVINAVLDARDLGLLEIAFNEQNLSALKYYQVDKIKNIVDVLLGSKLFVGHEGQVLRIVLKLTKTLDLPKGFFDEVNFDGERETILAFIESFRPILEDPTYTLFDAEGKLVINIPYLTEKENTKVFVNAMNILFGSYVTEGTEEFKNSKLIEVLLPEIYDKFVVEKGLIPDNFKEIVEIVKADDLTGSEFTYDLRRLVYIFEQLIEMNVPAFILNDGEIELNHSVLINRVIDCLHEINMIKGVEAEVLVWAYSEFLQQTLINAGYNVELTVADLAGVNWDTETKLFKDLVNEACEFLIDNSLTNLQTIKDFVANKDYLSSPFVNDENAEAVINLLTTATKLQTLEVVLGVGFPVVLNKLEEQGINVDTWKNFTGQELAEDIRNVLEIVKLAVLNIKVVDYYNNRFTGSLDLEYVGPNGKDKIEAAQTIVAKLFELNLVKGHEADLVRSLLNKFLKTTLDKFDIKAEDLALETINWTNEVTVLQEVIDQLGKLVLANNLKSIESVKSFVNNKEYLEAPFASVDNANKALDIVNTLTKLELFALVAGEGLDVLQDKLIDKEIATSFWNEVTDESLIADVKTLVEIARLAVNNLELVDYYLAKFEGDLNLDVKGLDNLDKVETIQLIIEKLFSLNLVKDKETILTETLLNKFLKETLDKYEIKISDLSLSTVDWTNEVGIFKELVALVKDFAGLNNILTLADAKNFVKEKWFMDTALVKDANLELVADALRIFNRSTLVANVLPQALKVIPSPVYESTGSGKYAVINLDFLKDLPKENLQADLLVFANIVEELVAFGATDLFENKLDSTVALTEENLKHVKNVINYLYDLNLLNNHIDELVAELMNFAFNLFDTKLPGVELSDFTLTPEDLSEIDFEQEFSYIADIIPLVGKFLESINNASIPEALDIVKEKEFTKQGFWTDEAINSALDIIDVVAKLKLVDQVLPIALAYGMNILSEKTTDLDFFEEYIEKEYTTEKLIDDFQVLVKIAKSALEFGALDFYFEKQLNDIDLQHVVDIINNLQELHLLQDIEVKWVNYLANLIAKLAKLDSIVSFKVSDFVNVETKQPIDFVAENFYFSKVLLLLNPILDSLELDSYDNIMSFIKNGDYTKLDFYKQHAETLPEIVNVLEYLVKSNILQVSYKQLFDYGFSKLEEKLDYNFIFFNPTKVDLVKDVNTLVEMLNDVVNIGAVEYLQYNQIEQINFEAVNSLVDKFLSLNLFSKYEADWVTYGINKVLTMLKISNSISIADFENVDWELENQTIKEIVNSLCDFLTKTDLDGYPVVYDFYKDKDYKSYDFWSKNNNANAILALDTLDKVVDLQIINSCKEIITEFGITKLNESNITIDFLEKYLNETYTGALLTDDLNTLVKIGYEAVELGALEYVLTNDLSSLDLSSLKPIIGYLRELNIVTDIESDWVSYIANIVMKLAKLDTNITFTADDFKKVYYPAENKVYQALVDKLQDVLTACELTNLQDVKDFINNKTYAELAYYDNNTELVDALIEALKVLVDSSIIQSTYPNFLAYGKDYVNDKFKLDISFLNPTQEALASDVALIVNTLKDVINVGALEFAAYGFIEEINFDALNVVVDNLFKLHVIADFETNWALLGTDKVAGILKVYNPLTSKDFEELDWAKENETLKAIIKGLGEFVTNNNLNAYPDILDFVKLGDYKDNDFWTGNNNANIDKAISILEDVVDLQLFKAVLPVIVNYGFGYLDDHGYPMVFLEDYLLSDEYTSDKFNADLNTIISIVKEALDFGALEYLFDKEISNIDLSHVIKIVDYLQDLNILVDNEEELIAYAANVILILTKLTDVAEFDSSEFNGIDFEAENGYFQMVVSSLSKALKDANLTSLSSIKSFITDKTYMNYKFLDDHPVVIENVLTALERLVQSKILEAGYVDLVTYGRNFAYNKGYDLSFLAPSKEEIAEDLNSLIDIIRAALDFGALEYMAYKDIEQFDFDALHTAVEKVLNLNVVDGYENNWMVVGLDFAKSKLNLNATVTADDFVTVNWANEKQTILSIVDGISEFLTKNNLDSYDEVNNFIVNKRYAEYEFWCENNYTNVDDVIAILEEVITLQILGPALPVISEYAVNFIDSKNLEMDFLTAYLTNDYTANKFYEDLTVLLPLANEAIHFGALEYVFKKDITNLDLSHVKTILGYVQDLNVVVDNEPKLVAYAANKVVTLAKLTNILDTFNTSEFTNINYEAENQLFQGIVTEVAAVLKAADLDSVSEILDFINTKKYLDYAYLDSNRELTNRVLIAVSSLADSSILQTTYLELLAYGIDEANKQKFDLYFLAPSVQELTSDIKALTLVARDAIEFGAFEYLANKTLTNIDVDILASILAGVQRLNIFNLYHANWAELISNKLAEYAKLNTYFVFTDDDFANINWTAEDQMYVNAVKQLKGVLEALSIQSLQDIYDLVDSASWKLLSFYTSDLAKAAVAVLETLTNAQSLHASLPNAQEYAIDLLYQKGYDISFLGLTKAQLAEDFSNLVPIIKDVCELGVYEYLDDREVSSFDFDLLNEVIAQLDKINLLNQYEGNWIKFAVDTVSKSVKLPVEIKESAFDDVNWTLENTKLQTVVTELGKFLQTNNIDSYPAIYDFVKAKDYMKTEFWTVSNIDLAGNALYKFAEMQVAKVAAAIGASYGVEFLKEKNYVDISFVKDLFDDSTTPKLYDGVYTEADLTNDVYALVNIAKEAVQFGVFDIIANKDIDDLDYNYIVKIVDYVQDLRLLQYAEADWVYTAVDKISSLLKIDLGLTKADYERIDYEAENAIFIQAIKDLDALTFVVNLNSISEILHFVNTKQFKDVNFYREAYVDPAIKLLSGLLDSNIIATAMNGFLDKGIEIANEKGYDVSFLADKLTNKQLARDVKQLLLIASDLVDAGGLEYLQQKDITVINYNAIKDAVAKLELIRLLVTEQANWANLVANVVADKLKLSHDFVPADFANVNWANDNVVLQNVIDEVAKFFNSRDVESLSAILGFNYKGLLYDDVLYEAADLIDVAVKSTLLDAVLPTLVDFGVEKVTQIDLSFITGLTGAKYKADLVKLPSILRDAADYGVLSFYNSQFKDEINFDSFDKLYNALATIGSLNILDAPRFGNAVEVVLEKLQVEAPNADYTLLSASIETRNVSRLLEQVKQLAQIVDIKTIDQAKADYKKALTMDSLNEKLTCLNNILGLVKGDRLLEQILFPLLNKYLPTDLYPGLVDIQNIYDNYGLFVSDLTSIQNVISEVLALDVPSIMDSIIDIPFANVTAVKNILNGLLGLHYLNDTNRGVEIVNALAPIYDLSSSIDASQLDLASDAVKLGTMYEQLVQVLTNPDFPVKRVNDFSSAKWDLNFFRQTSNFNAIKDAVNTYMSTTIFDQTGYLVLVVLVPVVKMVAPDYYNLFEIDTLGVQKLIDDFFTISDAVRKVTDLNLFNGGTINMSNAKVDLPAAIDLVLSTNILSGKENRLVKLLVRDFVTDKDYGVVNFKNVPITVVGVDIVADIDLVKDIIAKLCDLALDLGIDSLADLKNYNNFNAFKPLLSSQGDLELVEAIYKDVLTMSTIRVNAKYLYDASLGIKQFNGNLAELLDLSFYANNNELVADLDKLASVFEKANDFGVSAILADLFNNTANTTIDFEATEITDIMALLAEFKYVQSKQTALATMAMDMVRKTNADNFTLFDETTIDFVSEMPKYILAYQELAQILNRADAPYKDVQSIVNLTKNVKSLNWKYFIEYETGSQLVAALRELTNTDLMVEVVETALHIVSRQNNKYMKYVNPFGLTANQLRNDYVHVLDALQAALDFVYNNGTHTRVGNNISLDNTTAALDVIANIWNLNLLPDTKKTSLVLDALKDFGVDTSLVDLSSVDWDNEYLVIRSLVENTLNALQAYNKHDLKTAYLFAKDFMAMNFSNKAREIHKFAFIANENEVVEVIKALDQSSLVDQVLLEVYKAKLQNKLGSKFASVANLDSYTPALLSEDMHSLALVAEALLEIKAYEAYRTKTALDETALNAQGVTIIEELFGMNILTLKKDDLLTFIKQEMPKLGLDPVSFANVDFELDGQALSDVASELITLYNYFVVNENHVSLVEMLGSRELADAVLAIYDKAITTSIVKAVAPWGYNKFVGANFQSLTKMDAFNNLSDQSVYDLLESLGNALDAVVEIGLVGNDDRAHEVDFNNPAAVAKLAALFRDNFTLPANYMKVYNQFFNRLHNVGSFTLDYTGIELKAEVNTFKSIVNKAKNLVNTYSASFKSKNFSFVTTTTFQDQVNDVVNEMLKSSLLEQLLLPVLRGGVRVYSSLFGGVALFENDTVEEFNGKLVSEYLSDIYEFVGYANELGVFNNRLNYKNTDPMISIVDKLVTSELTKDNLSPLTYFALKNLAKIDVTTQMKDDIFNINWVSEAGYINAFLGKIKFAFNVAGFRINSFASMKNNTFLGYAQEALVELEDSQLLSIAGRTALSKYVTKVVTGNLGNILQTALSNTTYTDTLFVEDYRIIVEAINDVIEFDLFGSGDVISKLNNLGTNGEFAVVNLVEKAFDLNLLVGNEDSLVNELLSKVDLFDSVSFTFGFDWDDPVTGEKQRLIEVVTELVNFVDAYETEFGATIDFNNLDPAQFANVNVKPSFVAFIDALSLSELGQQILPSVYDSKVKPVITDSLGTDFEDIVDFSTLPANQWAAEFSTLLDVYSASQSCISGSSVTGTFADIADLIAQIFGLNSYPGVTAVTSDARHWLDVIVDMLPSSVTNGVTIDLDVVYDQAQAGTALYNDAYLQEAEALYDIVIAIDNVIGGSVDSFDYSSVYSSTDWTELDELLTAVVNAKSFRTLVVKLVGDMVNDLTPNTYFDPADLLSSEFNTQYNGGTNPTFNETFWDSDEVAYLSQVLAMTNVIDIETLDFETVELGKLHAEVDPTDVRSFDATGAGLLQLLQLMNYSKTFNLAIFGGNTGILYKFLVTDQGAVSATSTFGAMPTTASGANTEIKTIIDILDLVTTNSILGGNMADEIGNQDSQVIYDLLSTIYSSAILGNIIPDMVEEAINSNAASSGAIDINDLLAADFKSDNSQAKFWTDDQFEYLAKLVKTASKFSSGFDFADSSDLGIAGPAYDADLDVYDANIDYVGLEQMLKLMNVSNIFDITKLGGTGVMYDFLTDGTTPIINDSTFNTLGAMPTDVTLANAEIDAIIDLLDYCGSGTGRLNLLSGDMATSISTKTAVQINNVLNKFLASSVLKVALPYMVNSAIDSNAGSGTLVVTDFIDTTYDAIDWDSLQSTDPLWNTYWSTSQVEALAKLVVTANKFSSGFDFADSSDLGKTGPAYDAVLATYDTGIANVGLQQMLKLMNVSNIFDITALGGTGVMYDFLTDGTTPIIDDVTFNTLGTMPSSVTAINTEIDAIIDLLDYCSSDNLDLLSGDMATSISSKTAVQINNVLTKFLDSTVLKIALPYMVNSAIERNAGSGTLVVTDFIDTTYDAIDWDNPLQGTDANWAKYWSASQVELLAKLVVTANKFSSGFDFADPSDLGKTGPAYDAALATYDTGIANVGLQQMLKLMNVSNIFDITGLGGTGVMYDFLTTGATPIITDPTFNTLGAMPSDATLANAEIDAIISLLDKAGEYGLLSGDMATSIGTKTAVQINTVLTKFLDSTVLKIALPYMVNSAIERNAGSGTLVVTDFIDTTYDAIDWDNPLQGTTANWTKYWSASQVELLAKLVVTANKFSSGFDFADPSDLGKTGPAYDAALAIYDTGIANVGLQQMLKLMNVSNIFDITGLGGTGVMYEFLTTGATPIITDPTFNTLGVMPTDPALANTEIDAIINLLDYCGSPEIGLLSGNMANSLGTKTAVQINNVLTKFLDSTVLKIALPYMVNSAINVNAGSGTLVVTDFIDTAYKAIDWDNPLQGTATNWTKYWSASQVELLAKLVVTANKFSTGFDFADPSDLGKTGPAYDAALATYDAGIANVGLQQMLKLMNVSNIFDITVLGDDHVLYNFLTTGTTPIINDSNFTSLGAMPSDPALANTEIDAIINLLDYCGTGNMNLLSGDMASGITGKSTLEINNVFTKFMDSTVLKVALPYMVNSAIDTNAGSGELEITQFIDGDYKLITDWANATDANWNTYWSSEQLAYLAKMVKTASSLGTAPLNVFTMKLSDSSIDHSSPVTSFAPTSSNVNLELLLKLINNTNIFDITPLQGTGTNAAYTPGIIDNAISGNANLNTIINKPLGRLATDATKSDWDTEIDSMITSLSSIKSLTDGIGSSSIAEVLATASETTLSEFMNDLNNSIILREMLPEIVYETMYKAMESAGAAPSIIGPTLQAYEGGWLYDQQPESVQAAPKAEWTTKISTIATYIASL